MSVKHHRFESVGIQNIDCQPLYKEKPWCLIVPIAKTCGRKPGLKVAMIIVVVSITFPHHESSSDIICSFIVHCQYDLSPQSNFPLPHGLTILLPQTNSKTLRKCSLLSDSEATMKILPKKHDFKIVKDQLLIGSI